MEIPKNLVPKGNFDKKIEEALQGKSKQINDISELMDLSQGIKDYVIMEEARNVTLNEWKDHFGSLMPKYLFEAERIDYFKKRSSYFISIYALKFISKNGLNDLIKQTNINHEFLTPTPGSAIVQCLKKDNYMVSIHLNKRVIDDLKIFEDWYINNFRMEKI